MDIESHILSSFNDDLNSIKTKLTTMVDTVENSFESAMKALLDGDISLCSDVIAEDDTIDSTERIIDNLAMNTLLRYNPVASDLRFVVSSISIAKNLERIGDHASNIAKQTKKVYKNDIMSPDLDYIRDLHSLAQEQFNYAKQAILQNSTKPAHKCLEGEDNLRKITKKISKIFVKMMSNEGNEASTYLALIMIARSIERISRLSSNISEDIIYIETAEDVRN